MLLQNHNQIQIFRWLFDEEFEQDFDTSLNDEQKLNFKPGYQNLKLKINLKNMV